MKLIGCNLCQCICCCCILPMRYIISFMCVLGIIIFAGQRVVVHLIMDAIVHTVDRKPTCPQSSNSTLGNMSVISKRDWDIAHKKYIRIGFNMGHILMQIPCGLMCDSYGAKWPLIGGFVTTILTTIVLPFTLKYSPIGISTILRLIAGAGQAVIFPACASILAKWVPAAEKTTIGCFIFASNTLGYVTGFVSSIMIEQTPEWHTIFYFWAGLGILWILFFYLYCHSKPEEHPQISGEELVLLADDQLIFGTIKVPWREILYDKAVWVIVLESFGQGYLFTLMVDMPEYMMHVIGYDIRNNALYTFVPVAVHYLTAILVGWCVDRAIFKHNINAGIMRKSCTTIGVIGPNLLLCAIGYVRCNKHLAIIFYYMAMLIRSLVHSGFRINIMDITTRHCGLVMALVHTASAISGVVSRHVIGAITSRHTHTQWDIVFLHTLAINIIIVVIYDILACGWRRKWDYTDEELESFESKKTAKWYRQLPDDEFQGKNQNINQQPRMSNT